MSKTTSDDCKKELNARWPARLGENNGTWKRVSKTGNAKTGIMRVFHHSKQDLAGIVVETNGTIGEITFCAKSEVPAPEKAAKKSKTKVAKIIAPLSNGSVSADRYYFARVDGGDEVATAFA